MTDPLAPNSNRPEAGPALALRFISGKYQGGEFPIEEGREIVVGRSSDLEMVLVEEMVSRRHSRIIMQGGELSIEDLGSTNGTFVNGEKIQRARLKEGDRILIGTSILKVVPASDSGARPRPEQGGSPHMPPRGPETMVGTGTGGPGESTRMTGSIEEVPLPDLLQLFSTSKKTGVLSIRTETTVGRVHLKDGLIHYAHIDDKPDMGPEKAMFRMLAWEQGLFQLGPSEPVDFDEPLDLPAQHVLMEGFRQLDEYNKISTKLPDLDATLLLAAPLEVPLRSLSPDQLDVLQAALNASTVQGTLDVSPLTDLETAEGLVHLVSKGYLVTELEVEPL